MEAQVDLPPAVFVFASRHPSAPPVSAQYRDAWRQGCVSAPEGKEGHMIKWAPLSQLEHHEMLPLDAKSVLLLREFMMGV